jgi:hypothetical protein
MKISRKEALRALVLSVVFLVSFFVVFFAISLTQSVYSTPAHSGFVSTDAGTPLSVGPPPNATDIPLDTVIVLSQTRPGGPQLQITPEITIAKIVDTPDFPGVESTFYPAEPLKPATTYNVTAVVWHEAFSWSFTTTPQPFQPGISYYLAKFAFWIALASATATTLAVGIILWTRKPQLQR